MGGPYRDASNPIFTLDKSKCVLSDWSDWSACYMVRQKSSYCGTIISGVPSDGSYDRTGRRSCTGIDVSLLPEGTVSNAKTMDRFFFQNRSRKVVEKEKYDGGSCNEEHLF